MHGVANPQVRTSRSRAIFYRSLVSPLKRSGKSLVVLACVAAFSTAHAQGVPVIAPAELAQQTLMVQNLETQVTNMKAQLSAITGNSGFGSILNNPALRAYLPDQWQSVYDQARSGGLPGISASMRSIELQEGFTDAATAGEQRYNDTLAANKAMSMQAYDNTLSRLRNIEGLMQQSNATQTAAEKADLQNRLLAEQAIVQNEQTRLNLMGQLQQAELRMADQQRERQFKNSLLGVSNDQ